jgi:PAS domain S-box-containing protein
MSQVLVAHADEDGPVRYISTIARDITHAKRVERELHRQGAFLEAVALVGERLLTSPSWDEALHEVLARLGAAAEVSRAYIFENVPLPDGGRGVTLHQEWTAPDALAGVGDPYPTSGSYEGFQRWERILESGATVAGNVRELPDTERRVLEALGIISIMAVPLFVAGEWWGYLGFEDRVREREWSTSEVDALKAAAGIIGATIGRHLSEEARAESEERYRGLVELSPDAIVVHQNGRVVFVNRAAARLFGSRDPEQLIGRSVLEFVHPDSRPGVLSRLQRLREGYEVPLNEELFVRLDGTPVDVDVVASPIVLGGESAVQVVVRDVSERKRNERRLRRQNEYLEALHQTSLGLVDRLDPEEVLEAIVSRAGALLETEHGYVYLVDPDGDQLEVRVGRGAFADWRGYRLGRGEGLAGRIWETGRPQVIDDYDTWDGRAPTFPHGLFHACVCAPLKSGAEVVGVLGLAHVEPGRRFSDEDVALIERFAELASIALDNARLFSEAQQELVERRRAERTLRFQAFLLDIVENAVVATDGGDLITYWNAYAEQLLGRSAADVLGKPFREVIDIAPDVVEQVNKATAADEAWSGDMDVTGRDGSRFTAYARVSPIRGPNGRRDGLIGVFMDVTERRAAEEAVREAFEREKVVSKRLIAVDEMKNTFLEAVSHELRTPLSAILGLALTLERRDVNLPPERWKEMMGRLAFNARKLDRLLSDLLDLDRLSRGIVEPRRRATDVGALVRQVVAAAEFDRPVEVAAEAVVIAVDPAKIERIVENLVANAVRHTDPGTPIWVRVYAEDAGAVIAVEDAGPGVPSELQEAIFEPFRQGLSNRAHSPGVGIGLSLVARFAELHGGRAWVQDREGGGASFRVYLPAGRPTPEPNATEPPA